MKIFENVSSKIGTYARNAGNVALMSIGFFIVFFTAYSHGLRGGQPGYTIHGIDVAHAEAPACTGDAAGCGSGGDSGSGGCSGSDSGGSSGASCGSSGDDGGGG